MMHDRKARHWKEQTMDILKYDDEGEIQTVFVTDLEQQVIEDLQGFDSKVSTDDAIAQLKSLYPELVPYSPHSVDHAFWDYARTQRNA